MRDSAGKLASQVKCETFSKFELGRDCFLHYVRSKVIKRMEGFRVRHSKSSTSGTSPRKLLLPITFGASSLALLHILSEHLKSQKERVKKTGYQLLVVYVDESVIKKNTPALERLDEVKGRIVAAEGREEITFLTVPLEDIYSFKNAAEEAIESEVEENTSNRMMIRDGPNIDDKSRLQSLLSALASRTSQADILNILRTRLLVEVAKREGCEGVLWDDSTTRLAEKILSETAKGRGFSVPWQVADGPSPYGMLT